MKLLLLSVSSLLIGLSGCAGGFAQKSNESFSIEVDEIVSAATRNGCTPTVIIANKSESRAGNHIKVNIAC